MKRLRVLLVAAMAAMVLLAVAAPALAGGNTDRPRLRDDDRRISVSGDVIVPPDETVTQVLVAIDGSVRVDGTVLDSVFVGRGDLEVNGRVTGDLFVLRGDAVVTGRVSGDIVVVSGRAIVREGASVTGDVTSGDEPRVAKGTVDGEIDSLDAEGVFGGAVVAILIFLWIATTVSLAILGLVFVWLFPRAADATVVAASRVGPSIGYGLLVGIVGPIAAILVLSTVVGIPLAIVVLATLTLLYPLGYVASAYCLGRRLVKGDGTGSRIGAFFAGFAILRGAALIPGLGFLVWFGASIYGIGALTVAAWGASRGDPSVPRDTTPATAPEPASTAEPEPKTETKTETEPATEPTTPEPAKKAPAKKATATKKATS